MAIYCRRLYKIHVDIPKQTHTRTIQYFILNGWICIFRQHTLLLVYIITHTLHPCTHTYIEAYIIMIHTYIHTYILYIHKCIHPRMQAFVHTHTCMHARTRTHACIQTYIHKPLTINNIKKKLYINIPCLNK